LNTDVLLVGAYEVVKNSEDMTAVLDDAGEYVAQLGFAFGFAVPFGKDSRRDFDVTAKTFSRMTAQKKSVEKGCFPLRKVEIVNNLGRDELWNSCHGERAVYPKALPRQVVRSIPCCLGSNSLVAD